MSIEELSRMANGDNEDKEIKTKEGTCAICGKKGAVYTCDSCGKEACGECGELAESVDLLTGNSKTVFECSNCAD